MYKKNIFLISVVSIAIAQTSRASETEQPLIETPTETNALRKYYTENIAPNMWLIKKVLPGTISGGISGFLSAYAYNQIQQAYPGSDLMDKTLQLIPLVVAERIARFIANTFIAGDYKLKGGGDHQQKERWITGRVAQISSWLGFLYGLMR